MNRANGSSRRESWLRSPLLDFPVYPAAFAGAFVLTRYLNTNELLFVALRPTIVLVLLVVVIQLLASRLSQSPGAGAFVSTTFIAALLDPLSTILLLSTALAPLLLKMARRRPMGRLNWDRQTELLTIVGLVVLILNLFPAVNRVDQMPATPVADPGRASTPSDPDIYVILLDGYPRADTLLSEFGFDNQPFLDAMRAAGFDVAMRAHANYNATMLTLTSVLNMQQVNAVIPNPPERRLHGTVLVNAINTGAALDELRRSGYSIVTVPSGITPTSIFTADRYLDTGQVNSFEMSVLHAGLIPAILPGVQRAFLYGQQRDRIHAEFSALVDLAKTPSTRPRFTFAHVMSPHAPIVFKADGSPAPERACVPRDCTLFDEHRDMAERERLPGAIAYLNKLVLDAANDIISASTRPVVLVVFSDHGGRHDLENRDEMLRNLLLSYTPGRPGLFPDDATPVNIVPRVLNAYIGAGIPLASEESYQIDLAAIGSTGYFPLTPWPVVDSGPGEGTP